METRLASCLTMWAMAMATLPRPVIDSYTKRLNSLSDAARRLVAAQLAAIEYEGIADLRDKVIAILEPVCAASSDAAAAYAANFYDEVRELEIGHPLGAQAISAYSAEATAGAVRAMVQIIVDGGPWERFARKVADRADYEVKRSAGECVKANAARDPLRPRWARVPSGTETCNFCIMLASRGFVYTSEIAASEKKEGGHYHPNCDCRIVPGFEGMQVEGYDPDALYRQWRDSEIRRKGKKSVTFANDKVRERVLPHERRTAERLAGSHGMRPHFIQDYIWVIGDDGVKRKSGLPDLDGGIELKAVLDSRNARGAMRNHLKSASKKQGLSRVIVDNTDASFVTDEDLEAAAIETIGEFPSIPRLSLLMKSGELIDI